jgi:hypothetical protein
VSRYSQFKFLRRSLTNGNGYRRFFTPRTIAESNYNEIIDIHDFIEKYPTLDSDYLIKLIYSSNEKIIQICYVNENGDRFFHEKNLIRYLKSTDYGKKNRL